MTAELDPIEGYLRDEAPLDDAVVVVRGGPVAVEKFLEHARRQAREYSYRGRPMHSITYATAIVGVVRSAGFELLPTYGAPHYDLVLGSGEYPEAARALKLFSAAESNPFKRRGRFR